MAKKAKQPYPIQVRPSPEVREALRAAADAAGRTLNREMERRLEASIRSDLYEAWPTEDAARFQSFADVVGILSARVALTYGYDSETDALILGALQPALLELLKGMGADNQTGENTRFFEMLGRQMLAEIKQAANTANPTGEKAALAKFAKAWGIKGKGSP